ncbi:MAG: FHA domain-containing protein [Polyangiaceae bacterium]
MQHRAIEAEPPVASGLRVRACINYALRDGTHEHRLTKSPLVLVLGRGSGADIVVAGPLVSRQHAELRETGHGLVVADLSSRNGVFVNGRRLNAPALLAAGDTLAIGETTFLLVELPEPPDRKATWSDARPASESERVPVGTDTSDEISVASRRANALLLLGSVVDKALALGRGSEAEHVIGTHLVAALSDATAGRCVAPEVARSSAQYAVKLAMATGKPAWLDFAFRLYNALGQTIPLPIVDEMFTVLRRVPGIDRELLRRYTDFLRAHSDRMTISERFVLQRLEGLDRLAAWHLAG